MGSNSHMRRFTTIVLAADRAGDLDIALPQPSDATLAALDKLLPPYWSHGNPIDILGDAERRKNYDRMLRFTKGKDFSEFINDDAIRNKINKAYPALKKVLENVRALNALFKDAVKG